MKKFMLLLFVAIASFALVGCVSGDVLTDSAHDYYVTGQFAGWGDAPGKAEYKMEAIARNDERIKSIVKDTKDAQFIYVKEIVLPAGEAGWDVTYTINGKEVKVDGNLTVKMIRTDAGDVVPNWWAQSPESGQMLNLTPDTLYVTPFVEESVDGAGGWNDNPIALKAGTYYMVYVKYADKTQGLGLIEKVVDKK